MAERRILYKGWRIEVGLDKVSTADGGTVERDVVVHPGAVAILPLITTDRVCLVRNRRHTVGRTLLELPAGTLEPNEDPNTTAARELAEETGYRAGRIAKLIEFYPSPGVFTERMYLYVAEDLTAGEMNLDAGEDLRPEILDWDRAIELVDQGTIQDAKSIIGLLYWDRLRRRRAR